MTLDLTRVEVELVIEALYDHVDRMFARCEQMTDGSEKARMETHAAILEDIGDALSAQADEAEEETIQ